MAPFTRQQCAFASWCMDLASVAVVMILFQAWIQDLRSSGTNDDGNNNKTSLSRSFLESGFCNSPTMDTQWMCACLDITAGLLFIAMALGGPKKGIFSSHLTLPLAAYLLSHGYGHYQVATTMGSLKELTDLPPKEMATLAIILSIGPLDGMNTVLRKQQQSNNKFLYYPCVAVAVMALVALFKYGLGQKQNFALLYINLSILFTTSLPRVLLVGYSTESDVAYRVDKHPYFLAKLCTGGMVTGLVFLEPFYCDAFLARAGGHFLFDLSLLADAVCALVNDSACSAEKADKSSNNGKPAPKIKAV